MTDEQAQPALIFDLGNVLIEWNARHLYRRVFDGDELAMEAFFEEVAFFAWNETLDAGRSFADGVADLVARYPRHEAHIRAFHSRWPDSLGGAIEGSVEILRELHQYGYPLLALSNWSAETFHYAEARFAFLAWFDDVILSGRLGVSKPDARIFAAALERAGRAAEQCVFIDDSGANVAAARQLGIDAIHFVSPAALREELTRRRILASAG
jgi:2-haloacid dehalogenase